MMRIELVSYAGHKDEIMRIRHAVFVVGQHVPPELEMDGRDPDCVHVLVRDDAQGPVATGRMEPDGKIGRMAVLKSFRGQGIGRKMLDALIDHAGSRHLKRVYLNSQTHAVQFYKKAGFQSEGDLFYEADIPHIRMVLNLQPE